MAPMWPFFVCRTDSGMYALPETGMCLLSKLNSRQVLPCANQLFARVAACCMLHTSRAFSLMCADAVSFAA